jgi:hypothetical protein
LLLLFFCSLPGTYSVNGGYYYNYDVNRNGAPFVLTNRATAPSEVLANPSNFWMTRIAWDYSNAGPSAYSDLKAGFAVYEFTQTTFMRWVIQYYHQWYGVPNYSYATYRYMYNNFPYMYFSTGSMRSIPPGQGLPIDLYLIRDQANQRWTFATRVSNKEKERRFARKQRPSRTCVCCTFVSFTFFVLC